MPAVTSRTEGNDMDERLGEMTDDQVVAEWEETHVDNLDLAAGEEPPAPRR